MRDVSKSIITYVFTYPPYVGRYEGNSLACRLIGLLVGISVKWVVEAMDKAKVLRLAQLTLIGNAPFKVMCPN